MKQPQEAVLIRAAKVLIDLKEFDLSSKITELIANNPNDSPSLSVITTPDSVDSEAPAQTNLSGGVS
jgi:hypothetical protein